LIRSLDICKHQQKETRFKAAYILDRSNTGNVGSNPASFCVVFSGVGGGPKKG